MLFYCYTHFTTSADIEKTLTNVGSHYTVFPIIDPSSEGGRYLIDGRAFSDFNQATANEVDICYFGEGSSLDFDGYKKCLVSHLEKLDPDVRRQLHRPGFIVFFPKFEKAIFWPMRHTDRSPSDTEVYYALSGLWKHLTNPKYNALGIGNFTRSLDEGIQIALEPTTLRRIVEELLKRLF